MISRMAVGETPSPSFDCLNFFIAMDLSRFDWSLLRAKNTNPYVPSPILPRRSYCCNHAGLLVPPAVVDLSPIKEKENKGADV